MRRQGSFKKTRLLARLRSARTEQPKRSIACFSSTGETGETVYSDAFHGC